MIDFSVQEVISCCVNSSSYEEFINNQIKLFNEKQKKEREEFLEIMANKLDKYYYNIEHYEFSSNME